MDSDIETQLKEQVLAYEKKIQAQLQQQRYKTIIMYLILILLGCLMLFVGIIIYKKYTICISQNSFTISKFSTMSPNNHICIHFSCKALALSQKVYNKAFEKVTGLLDSPKVITSALR